LQVGVLQLEILCATSDDARFYFADPGTLHNRALNENSNWASIDKDDCPKEEMDIST